MTGGGARKSKSILSQKDELSKMRHQLEDYQRQTVDFERHFKELKDKSEQLSEQYFDASQQYNTLKEKVHHHELELDRLKHKRRILRTNMKNLNLRK